MLPEITPTRCCETASYDYGAAIAENRDINTKYDELKLQAIFLRSSPEFYKTDWIGNSSTSAVTVSNPDAFAVKLMNPDTSSSYWIVSQNDSTSTYACLDHHHVHVSY